MVHNYAKEAKWEASKEQKTRRAQRNKARRHAIAEGLVKKGDGKELDHAGFNRHGKLGNKVNVVTQKQNRGRQPRRDGSQD